MTNATRSTHPSPVAIVTGGSRGLGRALVARLAGDGWRVVTDGRDADRLARAVDAMDGRGRIRAVDGDVRDPGHRLDLVEAAWTLGRLDALVNNASILGPSPQPGLADYPLDVLTDVYHANVLAPLALAQLAIPLLTRSGGRILNLSSDAAVEPYEGWGGYGSSKAALDQLSAVLGAEHPDLRVYAVDPGDMATDLHQQAFPGEDISDRASPESVVPALLELLRGDLPSGRYRAAGLVGAAAR
jgi:NAD(P)-dependent dehydrogenase (short-subunit alcohol dehydrogenase family)